LLWNKLPESVPTHWGFKGEVNGYSSKRFAVFGLPLIMSALQWICAVATSHDPKITVQHESVWKSVIWICPIISLYMGFMIYSSALGKSFHVYNVLCLFMGILFIYLSRIIAAAKPNRTIGIRIKWTLSNEKNWSITHRLASRIWLVGGIAMLLCILLPHNLMPWFLVSILLICTIIPVIYSFIHRNEH